jgi:hypothetical protein
MEHSDTTSSTTPSFWINSLENTVSFEGGSKTMRKKQEITTMMMMMMMRKLVFYIDEWKNYLFL